MTEERSCEEAFDAWFDDDESRANILGLYPAFKDAFRAGWAARTPTLPAGMTAAALREIAEYHREVCEVADWGNADVFTLRKWADALDSAAGDRPPAEREET